MKPWQEEGSVEPKAGVQVTWKPSRGPYSSPATSCDSSLGLTTWSREVTSPPPPTLTSCTSSVPGRSSSVSSLVGAEAWIVSAPPGGLLCGDRIRKEAGQYLWSRRVVPPSSSPASPKSQKENLLPSH